MTRSHRKTCIIGDPAFPIEKLAKRLISIDPNCRIVVCENLGYSDEKIYEGTFQDPPVIEGKMFILFVTGT